MQFPITIGLHRSRFLVGAFVFLVLLTVPVLFLFQRSTAIFAAISLLVAVLLAWLWRYRQPRCPAIRLEASGVISLAAGDGDFVPAQLLPGAAVHPWLTVLRLRNAAGRVCVLCLTVDSLKKEDFRRLRVFLRWRADFSGADDAV